MASKNGAEDEVLVEKAMPEGQQAQDEITSVHGDEEGQPLASAFGLKIRELRRQYNLLVEDFPVNLGKAISKKQRERESLKDPV